MRIVILALALITAPAIADTPKPADDKEKLVCKREVPIGSLIARRKVCLTKAQWDIRIRDGNEETRKMMYDGTTRQMSN